MIATSCHPLITYLRYLVWYLSTFFLTMSCYILHSCIDVHHISISLYAYLRETVCASVNYYRRKQYFYINYLQWWCVSESVVGRKYTCHTEFWISIKNFPVLFLSWLLSIFLLCYREKGYSRGELFRNIWWGKMRNASSACWLFRRKYRIICEC